MRAARQNDRIATRSFSRDCKTTPCQCVINPAGERAFTHDRKFCRCRQRTRHQRAENECDVCLRRQWIYCRTLLGKQKVGTEARAANEIPQDRFGKRNVHRCACRHINATVTAVITVEHAEGSGGD